MAYIWELPGWNSGTKVRRRGWERGHYIYRKDGVTWVYYVPISSEGIAQVAPAVEGITQVAPAVMDANDWEPYIETPTEVEVFEWLYENNYGGWYTVDKLMTEAEAAEYFGSLTYRKTGRSFKVPVTEKK